MIALGKRKRTNSGGEPCRVRKQEKVKDDMIGINQLVDVLPTGVQALLAVGDVKMKSLIKSKWDTMEASNP